MVETNGCVHFRHVIISERLPGELRMGDGGGKHSIEDFCEFILRGMAACWYVYVIVPQSCDASSIGPVCHLKEADCCAVFL